MQFRALARALLFVVRLRRRLWLRQWRVIANANISRDPEIQQQQLIELAVIEARRPLGLHTGLTDSEGDCEDDWFADVEF